MGSLSRITAALTLGLGLAACGGGGLGSTPTAADESGDQLAASVPLLSLIAHAPSSAAFDGVRRYEAIWDDNGIQQHLVYREHVVADGQGQFSLTAEEILEPPMNASQVALFKIMHELRARTMYYARDFGVHDVGLFELNYSLVDTGQQSVVAGVTCQRMFVRKKVGADRLYLLDVHAASGLILSSREQLLDGTIVTQVAFESIDLTPDLNNVPWNQKLNNGEQDLIPGTQEASEHLSFQPRLPKLLPQGWQQVSLSKLTDPNTDRVWAKAVYTDGVELIYFVVAKYEQPKKELKYPPPGTPPKALDDRVKRMAVGNWTLLDADLSKGHALVLGRTQDGVLEDLVQSAFY